MAGKVKKPILKSKKPSLILIAIVFAVIGVIALIFAKAESPAPSAVTSGGTASLVLEPASGSVNNGDTLSVKLYEDSGTQPVNAVDIGMIYDTAKLQYVSGNTTGSQMDPVQAPAANGGVVILTSFINPGKVSSGSVTGKQLIATFNFKALAGSGTTSLTFQKGVNNRSAIYLAKIGTNIWNGVTTGGNYTLTTPSTGGGGGGSGGGTGGGTTTPTTTKTTTTKNTTTTSNPTNTGTTNPSTTQPTTSYNSSTPVNTAVRYNIVIQAVDGKGKVLPGASVSLDSGKAVNADALGLARFTGVSAGTHTINVSAGMFKKSSQKINVVANGDATSVQSFSVAVKSNPALLYGLSAFGITALAAISFMLYRRHADNSLYGSGSHTASTTSSTVVTSSVSPEPQVFTPKSSQQ